MAQYINKSAVVAVIKHHIKEEPHSYFCKCLLSEIDTLEVKELDLEKALDNFYKQEDWSPTDAIEYDTHKYIARHFFELGLKAQKGE